MRGSLGLRTTIKSLSGNGGSQRVQATSVRSLVATVTEHGKPQLLLPPSSWPEGLALLLGWGFSQPRGELHHNAAVLRLCSSAVRHHRGNGKKTPVGKTLGLYVRYCQGHFLSSKRAVHAKVLF